MIRDLLSDAFSQTTAKCIHKLESKVVSILLSSCLFILFFFWFFFGFFGVIFWCLLSQLGFLIIASCCWYIVQSSTVPWSSALIRGCWVHNVEVLPLYQPHISLYICVFIYIYMYLCFWFHIDIIIAYVRYLGNHALRRCLQRVRFRNQNENELRNLPPRLQVSWRQPRPGARKWQL